MYAVAGKICFAFFFGVAFFSCSKPPEKKAMSAVVHHLEKTLKDPASYIPVDFHLVKKHPEPKTDTLSMRSAELAVNRSAINGWHILHKYRYRNEAGKIKDTQSTFFIHSDYRVEKVD